MAGPWRILFCNSNPVWGGGEHWHLEFARRLALRGHSTGILAASGSALASRAAEAGVPLDVIPMGRLGFLNPALLLRLVRLLRTRRPDVLVCGLPQDLKAVGQAARWAGVPLVLYRRGMGLPVRDTAFNRHLYRRVAHGVIVNAQDNRRALLAANPCLLPEARIHLLPNGVDEALLQRPAPLWGEPGAPILLGSAGRLVEQKGQALLLSALGQLRERCPDLDWRLTLAGEGPLREALERQAADLSLGARVRFAGFVQDVPEFLAGLHVFAFPSLWEGMGNALLEAMALARPVAGFAVSSMPELVRHEETGLLAAPGAVPELSALLERLCREAELRQGLGLAARELVREHYSLPPLVLEFETLLEGLLHRRGSA